MAARTPPITVTEAADILGAMPAILSVELNALPATLPRWRPEPEAWCMLEALGHLIETEERAFAGRIRQILARPSPVFSGWDPAGFAAERGDDRADPAVLLAEFTARRNDSVALLRSLGGTDLTRGGDHPEVGELTINDLIHEWIHHDREHLQQIPGVTQAAVRPHMGNAGRFSEPE